MERLVEAVRELRAALGDSQQAFATRLGLSMRAIANYEKDRAPAGKALYKLERLAMAHGRIDLAREFWKALAQEMDWANEPAQPVWSGLVRELVRNEHNCPGWPNISNLLIEELEGLIRRAKSGTKLESVFSNQQEAVAYLENWLLQARLKVTGSAQAVLAAMKEERMRKHPDESEAEAASAILLEHPELYTQFQQEQAEAARQTTFETLFDENEKAAQPESLHSERKEKKA